MADLSIHDLINAINEAGDPASLISAVRALATAQLEAGIPTLIQVLGYNNPGAAVAAVNGLVQLGDVAVQPLLDQIDGYNYGARAYAIRALAAIADPRALQVLLEAAETDFAPSVRRAASKGLGYLRWQQLPSDCIASAQDQTCHTLLHVSHDLDWAIRYAAVVGLQALAEALFKDATRQEDCDQPKLFTSILTRFEEMAQTERVLAAQARVRFAQQRLAMANQPFAANHTFVGSTLATN